MASGVVGVNWNVRLLPVKFLDTSGSGTTDDAIASIDYAVRMGARVINASWGGGGFSQAMRQAIQRADEAGIVFAAAAGNYSSDTDLTPFYPSSYDLPNIVSVAATNDRDVLAGFSNFGATTVDLAAPGENILSTFPGNTYGQISGTSMATPHVAGALALIFGRYPQIGGTAAKELLLSRVDILGALSGRVLTGGRLNAFLAIADADSIPPGSVSDLAVSLVEGNRIGLSWTASGDDGNAGRASRYEARYATTPITEESFATATPAPGPPEPLPSGSPQTLNVTGLAFSTTHYLAIRVFDEFDNGGPISNVVSATTLGPPDIGVAPASLSADLLTGQSATRVLTVSNTGVSELVFQVGVTGFANLVQAGGRAQPELARPEVISTTAGFMGSARLKPLADLMAKKRGVKPERGITTDPISSARPPQYTPAQVGSSTMAGAEVLIVQDTRPWDTQANEEILQTLGIAFDVIPSAMLAATDLTPYRLMIVPSDQPTSLYTRIYDAAAQLDNYVLLGGVLEFHAAAWGWAGGDASGVTLPGGTRIQQSYSNRNDVLEPGHPLVAGVPNPFFGSYASHAHLTDIPALATVITADEVGVPNLVVYGHGAGTVIAGGQTFEYGFRQGEDPGIILANMIPYAHELVRRWVRGDPPSGIVPVGGTAEITVTLDAGGLVGGDYEANVRIASNDPDESVVPVPVHLHVTGAPDIAVSPIAFDFGGVFLGVAKVESLVVSNPGTDQLTVSEIVSSSPEFTVDGAGFILAPRAHRTVAVSFQPTSPVSVSGTLTVRSTDPDEAEVMVPLAGIGLVPPDIGVTPPSLSVDLLTNQQATRTLTIENDGGSDLTFMVELESVVGNLSKQREATSGHEPKGQSSLAAEVAPPSKGQADTRQGNPVVNGRGGPDSFGYRWIDNDEQGGPHFNWIDISGIGTLLPYYGDDWNFGPVAIGFEFPFYGQEFHNLFVCSNGWISFTSTSASFGYVPLPSPGAPENMLAAMWADLYVQNPSVYVHSDGNRMIVQYENVRYLGGGPPMTFQIVLYPTGRIVYQYLDMGGMQSQGSVGIQNGARDDGLTIAFNTPYVRNGLAIEIAATPHWLSALPASGTIPAGGSAEVTVAFDATGLYGGDYNARVRIVSNDPDELEVAVPVHLGVTGVTDITLSPSALHFPDVFVGGARAESLVVRNEGTSDLVVSGIGTNSADFVVDGTGFTLGPEASRVLIVTFLPSAPGPTSAVLTVLSNDPDEAEATVALTGLGLVPPDVSVAPASLSVGAPPEGQTTRTLTIENSGGSDLFYQVSAGDVAAALMAQGGRTPPMAEPSSRPRQATAEAAGPGNQEPWTRLALEAPPKGQVDARQGPPVIESRGGLDTFGYRWIDSDEPGGPAFNWIEISGIGAQVPFGGDDWNYGSLPVGFAFPFYGQNFTNFYICSNGWISFTSQSASFSYSPLPNPSAPENMLAALWADLYAPSGSVFYHSDGSRLVVEYKNVSYLGNPTPFTFEIVIYPSGKILYQYLDMAGTQTYGEVGIQNAARNDGLNIAFNTPYVRNGLAVEISPMPRWLSVMPISGTVPAGGQADLTVTFDTRGLEVQEYSGFVRIDSNDPDESRVSVPVILRVLDEPFLQLETQALAFGDVFVGYSRTMPLVLRNIGLQPLQVTSLALPPDYSISPAPPFTVGTRESVQVNVTFAPSGPGTADGDLVITTNALASPHHVDLTAVGLMPPIETVSPASVHASASPGSIAHRSVQVCNTGGSPLSFRARLMASQGPLSDNFGHSWTDSDHPDGPTFEWVDVSAVGTPIPWAQPYEDNAVSGPLPIGFAFPFYENDFTTFRVCTNGWISFTSDSTSPNNAPLPAPDAPENLVAGFWDNLIFDGVYGSQAYYHSDGNRLVVQFNDMRPNIPPFTTFEIILYRDGRITFQYLRLAANRTSATVGIQNALRDDGLTVTHNTGYLHDGLAVEIRRPGFWARIAGPDSMTVLPGSCVDLDLELDASVLEEGEYEAALHITSNDPVRPAEQVPVAFSVQAPVTIEFDLDPNSLKLGGTHMGQWATGYLEPAPPSTPNEIDLASIRLNGSVPRDASGPSSIGDHDGGGRPDLMVKFRRAALALVLPEGDRVPIVVTGLIGDRAFVGHDTIRVRRGRVVRPMAHETVGAGLSYSVQYEVSGSESVQWVALLHSFDLGVTWTIDRTHLPNTGAVTWTVPAQVTDSALVAVVEVEEEGKPGLEDVVGVLGVSDYFSIVGTVDVPSAPLVTELLPVRPNPSAGPAHVRFALAHRSDIALEIFDLQGRRLCTLARGAREPGWHESKWDGADEKGVAVGAGLFFVRLRIGSQEWTQRVARTR